MFPPLKARKPTRYSLFSLVLAPQQPLPLGHPDATPQPQGRGGARGRGRRDREHRGAPRLPRHVVAPVALQLEALEGGLRPLHGAQGLAFGHLGGLNKTSKGGGGPCGRLECM